MPLRDFAGARRAETVRATYAANHARMTVAHVEAMHRRWLPLARAELTVKEALDLVDTLVDDSDPDVEGSNAVHAFQTAEALRQAYPAEPWLHLVGLLHDLGKVMVCLGDEPQWNVVGDTFPVGCRFDPAVVHHELFAANPDAAHPVYGTEHGVYAPHCGLRNVRMSWGHDEYLHAVLAAVPGCRLPPEGLAVVRYHSFYAWHTGGAYQHLTDAHDREVVLPAVRRFNEHDLYSKAGPPLPPEARERLWRQYYSGLCERYGLGGKLRW
jgi:inositol oxygenase